MELLLKFAFKFDLCRFIEAVPTYAPREYKMCQRAGLQAVQHTFIVLTRRRTPVHSVMDDAASTGTLCGG